jgi:hypothetical protein
MVQPAARVGSSGLVALGLLPHLFQFLLGENFQQGQPRESWRAATLATLMTLCSGPEPRPARFSTAQSAKGTGVLRPGEIFGLQPLNWSVSFRPDTQRTVATAERSATAISEASRKQGRPLKGRAFFSCIVYDLKPRPGASTGENGRNRPRRRWRPDHTGSLVGDEEAHYQMVVPDDLTSKITMPEAAVADFITTFEPSESADVLHLFVDSRTLALYSECHVSADKLISLSTTDVPFDPEDQHEYRANRDIVADHSAFFAMKEDANQRRSFSNIVSEFTTEFEPEHPLKILGGQHRFEAIKEALAKGITESHGIKVYFGLIPEERLEAQLISNTVIAVPTDPRRSPLFRPS